MLRVSVWVPSMHSVGCVNLIKCSLLIRVSCLVSFAPKVYVTAISLIIGKPNTVI